MNRAIAISLMFVAPWGAEAGSKPADVKKNKDGQAALAAKRFNPAFQNAKLGRVWEWLSKETGMPVLDVGNHQATITILPTRKDLPFTEVFDLLNQALAKEKLYLMHRKHTFLVVPMPGKEIPGRLENVLSPDELDDLAETAFVTLFLPLKGIDAEEALIPVKRLLGPYGNAVSVTGTNGLLIQDEVRTVRRLVGLLKLL